MKEQVKQLTTEEMNQIEMEMFPNQFNLGSDYPARGRVVLRIAQRGLHTDEWTNIRPNKYVPALKDNINGYWDSFVSYLREHGGVHLQFFRGDRRFVPDGGGSALLRYLQFQHELNIFNGDSEFGNRRLNRLMKAHIKSQPGTILDYDNARREKAERRTA